MGYGGGDIYIYKKIEKKDATELEQEIKRYGYHQEWDIIDSNTTLGMIKANLETQNNHIDNLNRMFFI